MKNKLLALAICLMQFFIADAQQTQHSVARQWNETLLQSIRLDFSRPTVHARNLFHISAAMYDAWAVFESNADTYFLGKTVGGFQIPFDGFTFDAAQKQALQEEAISHAAFGIISHRFLTGPNKVPVRNRVVVFDSLSNLMTDLGYDQDFTSIDYSTGSAAALGNYIADRVIAYGMSDGANEANNYESLFYEPVNEPLKLDTSEFINLADANRWQPLSFGQTFIDQQGNEISDGPISFLGPEWGNVAPFSLTASDKEIIARDGNDFTVYKNPGDPVFLDSLNGTSIDDPFKWGFALVAVWSSHLNHTDGTMWDISPKGVGNIDINNFPEVSGFPNFYDLTNGGDGGEGYTINPKTNQPYEEHLVPRGDFGRVIAEFWADGPDSETPPGHWFTLLNEVSDHPLTEKRFMGIGETLDDLEWDILSYFMMGGAMHDVAIAAWSVKGYHDYVRPITAIRYMATKGQSSDPTGPRYDPAGIPLIDGFIEQIGPNDPLVGANNEFLNEIKVLAWRGHDFIQDPETDIAGVGWIKAIDWWPYQRPTFVTPPFAGYISGHSTFSRAGAEILTIITGDEYFPGGLGEFVAKANEFLVFERGPSVDVTLQWAKYYDASDQSSLSRIWGGIHPPVDDIPGRKWVRR